jgi:uncharacterized oligopeptide transporter (OPT) family protein
LSKGQLVIFSICISILLSFFSTAVMSYISMATPIGPWIAPTIVLCALLLCKLLGRVVTTRSLALITSAASVGGILATGFGFSFPTLYFVDPNFFNQWLEQPGYFILVMGCFALVAGGLGIWFGHVIAYKLIEQDQLAFPIGQLVYKMIAVHQNLRKAYELISGFVVTILVCIAQDGFWFFKGIFPKGFTLLAPVQIGIFSFPLIRFDLWPMVWAIGFIMGYAMIVPLAIGALTKIILIDPLNTVSFNYLSNTEFILAFCSGMVLYGALLSFIDLPGQLMRTVKKVARRPSVSIFQWSLISILEMACLGILIIAFLFYFKFPLLSQVYLLLGTLICTYQIAIIAGKIGLAPLGRFATFVMMPALLLFQLDMTQIIFIATFVEVCGGVAADVLFSLKMGELAHIEPRIIKWYQYLGLLVSACILGIVFLLLIQHLHLGSPELFAYKAQSRQLLLQVQRFDYLVLIIGMLFGALLKYVKVNPMLVLGGLLMPLNLTLGLVIGGLLTLLTKHREEWEPFWSGVFAANSLWMLIRSLIKII